jgi:hypothetical protein
MNSRWIAEASYKDAIRKGGPFDREAHPGWVDRARRLGMVNADVGAPGNP